MAIDIGASDDRALLASLPEPVPVSALSGHDPSRDGWPDVMMTDHGEFRTRKRAGLPKKAANKLAEQALVSGTDRRDISGRLRRYLDALLHRGDADNIRVFRDYVFIFRGRVLITMWMLHPKYRGIVK